ncbi:hypothetical protein BDN72DRAFT_680094 [Pluteus cervinus]|uniref:Uncharacterized protein n=1 Tax=Pluteus cervinus TaxID=181527 RepID=A0ACD3AT35_9AGAR|nr:hypothetical protein BDN72DRAFT_680094 [Pluteus cervinus]
MADSLLDLLYLNDVVVTCATDVPDNATVQRMMSLVAKVSIDGDLLLTTDEVKPTPCSHPIQGIEWNFRDLDPIPTECMFFTVQIVAKRGASRNKEVVLIELGILQKSGSGAGPYATSVAKKLLTRGSASLLACTTQAPISQTAYAFMLMQDRR